MNKQAFLEGYLGKTAGKVPNAGPGAHPYVGQITGPKATVRKPKLPAKAPVKSRALLQDREI